MRITLTLQTGHPRIVICVTEKVVFKLTSISRWYQRYCGTENESAFRKKSVNAKILQLLSSDYHLDRLYQARKNIYFIDDR